MHTYIPTYIHTYIVFADARCVKAAWLTLAEDADDDDQARTV